MSEAVSPVPAGNASGDSWKPVVLGQSRLAPLDGSSWVLEIRERPDRELGRELTALGQRSGGTSLFFEPPFINAAWHRFGGGPKRLMVLFEESGDAGQARLAFPFAESAVGFPPSRVWRAFSHPYAPLSLPLMEAAPDTLAAERFAAAYARLSPRLPLVFQDFPAEEKQAARLIAALQAEGLALAGAEPVRRGVLRADGGGTPDEWMGRKRRKELERQLRRLQEGGAVSWEIASEFRDVLLRFEEFLLLETKSWKGRRGTSIHVLRKTAAFARQAVGAMAREGRASILSLRLDDRAIASLVLLRSGNRFYPWKIAFDEELRAQAPGALLIVEATRHLLAREDFELADSLARPGGWIERIWPQTLALQSLVVADTPREATRLAENLDRLAALRQRAKQALGRA